MRPETGEGRRVVEPRDGDAVPLAVVGCDFRVASTAWRNVLMLDEASRRDLAGALATTCEASGLVVLETCNRVEWLIEAPRARWAGELARAQMLERWRAMGHKAPLPTPYLHCGEEGARHLLRVALGMESFVVGEREIAGQLNKALGKAREIGTASAHLNALQTTVGRVVKRVHRLTRFGARTRGVHSLAVEWLQTHLPPAAPGRPWRIAVVGMGEIGRKAATICETMPGMQVLRINRTVPPKREGQWIPMASGLDEALATADGLIVATGAQQPVIDAAHVAALRSRPLWIVDIGTPGQVRPGGGSKVHLAGLDQLLVGHPKTYDDDDLHNALAMVDEAVEEYRVVCRKRGVARLLRAAQDAYDQLAYETMPELLRGCLPDLGEDDRTRVEAEVRIAVRAYTRAIVREIEAAVDPNPEDES